MAGTNLKEDCVTFLPNSAVAANKTVNTVYRRYDRALRAFLVCRLKSWDINDVAQEVYLRLVRHPRLEELDLRFSLLCKIASDIVTDRYRRQCVRKEQDHVSFDELELRSLELSPEQALESKEGIAVIREALVSLNRKSRKAIILYRFRNLTYKEISMEMGISISMVRKHVLHAMQHITRKVNKYHENRTKKAPGF